MKLIPKDALVAEIERIKKEECPIDTYEGRNKLFYFGQFLSFLDTLEVKEVDYKPIDKDFERDAVQFCFDNALNTTPRIAKTIAKHFFELGLKASSNISIDVTSIDEELKENGIDPNSKEAKIIKESYYTAIEKLSVQKESLEECGFNDLKDEFKDVVKALKGE